MGFFDDIYEEDSASTYGDETASGNGGGFFDDIYEDDLQAQENLANRGDLNRGLRSGYQRTVGLLAGAGGAVADAMGSDYLAQKGYDEYQRRNRLADLNPPTVGRVEDINSWGDFADWLQYTAAGQAPNFATMAATGGVTGLAGKTALKGAVNKAVESQIAKGISRKAAERAVANRLAQLGTVAGSSALETGGMWGDDVQKHGIGGSSPAQDILFGTISGATEAWSPTGKLASAIGGARRAVAKDSGRSLLKKFAIEIPKGMNEEGLQEVTQSLISDINAKIQDPDVPIYDKQHMLDMLNEYAAGAAIGGIAGPVNLMFEEEVKAPGDKVLDDVVDKALNKETESPLSDELKKEIADSKAKIDGENIPINTQAMQGESVSDDVYSALDLVAMLRTGDVKFDDVKDGVRKLMVDPKVSDQAKQVFVDAGLAPGIPDNMGQASNLFGEFMAEELPAEIQKDKAAEFVKESNMTGRTPAAEVPTEMSKYQPDLPEKYRENSMIDDAIANMGAVQQTEDEKKLSADWRKQEQAAKLYNLNRNKKAAELTPEMRAFMEEYEKGPEYVPGAPPQAEYISDKDADEFGKRVLFQLQAKQRAAAAEKYEQQERENRKLLNERNKEVPPEVRKATSDEASRIAKEDPVYSQMAEIKKRGGINLESFKNDYDSASVQMINMRYPGLFSKVGRNDADELAQEFGYPDSNEMVQRFTHAKTIKEIEADIIRERLAEWEDAEAEYQKAAGRTEWAGTTEPATRKPSASFPAREEDIAALEDVIARHPEDITEKDIDHWTHTAEQRDRLRRSYQAAITDRMVPTLRREAPATEPATTKAAPDSVLIRENATGVTGPVEHKPNAERIEKISNQHSVAHGQEVNVEPSEAQKKAENYKKAHVRLDGLDISIENPVGSVRSGTDAKGNRWSQEMKADYGYVKGSVGYDKDHVDVFIKPGYKGGSDKVFVVDQYNDDGTFDEHKVIIGVNGKVPAKRLYNSNYEKGWKGGRDVTPMTMDEFKEWVKSDGPKRGPAAGYPGTKIEEKPSSTIKNLSKAEKTGGKRGETSNHGESLQVEYGGENKIFTADAAEKARELLRKKLGQLSSGVDPEIMQAGITLAGYHIEAGARKFADFSKAMVADLGDAVKPYLRSFYEGVRHYPGMDNTGMSSAEEIEAAVELDSRDNAGKEKKTEAETTAADMEIVEVFSNDLDGVSAKVFRNRDTGKYHVTLMDTDAGEQVPGVKIFPADAREQAIAHARKLAGVVADVTERKPGVTEQEFRRSLERRGAARDSRGRDFKVLQADPDAQGREGSFYYQVTEDGARMEKGPGYPARWTRQTAIDKAVQAADLAGETAAEQKKASGQQRNQAGTIEPKEENTSQGGEDNGQRDTDTNGILPVQEREPDGKTGDKPLEGVVPEEGGNSGKGERAGRRGEKGGTKGVQRNAGRDKQRNTRARGRKNGAGAVHPAETGTGGNGAAGQRDGRRDGLVDPAETPANIPAKNFTITDEVNLGKGGEAAKFADNLAAIETLKKIEREQRRATPEEQRTLARYVGWGGLKNAFRNPVTGKVNEKWKDRVERLESLLSPEELDAARNTVKAAHYTSQDVVQAIWRAAQRLGFQGGNVLEPSMGTGNFLGLAPESVKGDTNFLGVEYDSITARIAKLLYPRAEVIHSGFENLPIPANSFDMAIGNPPFGRDRLTFKYSPNLNHYTIHNQFFLASADALKPGGVQAMVVSRYFMDASDASARMGMADRGMELIGAVRLPDTAFRENARTEVVTDILLFRKKESQEGAEDTAKKEEYPDWVNITEIPDPLGGDPMTVNSYFAAHPEAIIGTMDRSGSMQHGNDITVHMDNPADLPATLNKTLDAVLPKNVIKETPQAEKSKAAFDIMRDALHISMNNLEDGSVRMNKTGDLVQVFERETEGGDIVLARRTVKPGVPWSPNLKMDRNGKWFRKVDKVDEKGNKVKEPGTRRNQKVREVFENEQDIPPVMRLSKKQFARLTDAVNILSVLRDQLDIETKGASPEEIKENRKKLRSMYSAFRKKHGFMHDSQTKKALGTMPDSHLLMSLEHNYKKPISKAVAKRYGVEPRAASAEESAILKERVIYPYTPPGKADSPQDALAITLSEYGRVDLERMAELLDMSEEQVTRELHDNLDEPILYNDPETDRWVTADEYLSGNVVRKLEAAKEAGLTRNVENLEKVLPEKWGADKITPVMGATWIPEEDYAAFVEHLTGNKAMVRYSPVTNTFSVTGGKSDKSNQYATPARSVRDLVESILNSRTIKVTYTVKEDGETKTVVDQEQTDLANQKADEIKEEFANWIFMDGERRNRLVDLFNRKYNVRVIRQRNGQHLKLPGKVPDAVIRMRRHQLNAIWRGITDRTVLYDHTVGSGKTFTGIARAMERKRMGLSRKPMIVVPNHMVEQFAADVHKLYPGAKMLAAGSKDLSKQKRRRVLAQIATGDWDIIILPHSSFGFIGISPETEERYLNEELKLAEAALQEAQAQAEEDFPDARFKPLTVAEAERLRDKILDRLKRIKEKGRKKDNLVTFEQMGVDDLTIDESHEFKNLFYNSRLQVRGMNPKAGSAKAYDLWTKIRVLRESPTGSVAFMTGTPISNSAVEMYNTLRYLANDELQESGLEHFDSWRAQFATVSTQYEPTESGRGLKEVNRIGRDWSNMRALMDLYYTVADSVTNEDIKRWYSEDHPGEEFPIPKVKGGGRRLINVPPTPAQEREIASIVDGFEGLEGIRNIKERSAERLRLMDRARKVSLDVRAVNPKSSSKEKGGKLEAASNEIFRIYKEWDKEKGAQLVFLDRSIPKANTKDKRRLKKYDALVARLERAEISGDEKEYGRVLDALQLYDRNEMEEIRAAQDGGWNAYQQIKDNLVSMGIPENEVRFIHEANNDEQKQELFDMVNEGAIRVLIGSTPRMGAGTNAQKRLVALHHIDVTWKPSDIEQREGRIIRQGNDLYQKYRDMGKDFEVEILAYTTDTTVDAKLWSLNATKLKMINGIRNYKGDFNMEFEDEDSVSMAEIAAIASGEPLQLERIQLASEVDRLKRLEWAWQRQQFGYMDELDLARRNIEQLPGRIKRYEKRFEKAEAIHRKLRERAERRKVTVNGKEFSWLNVADAISLIDQENHDAEKNGVKLEVEVDGKPYRSRDRAVLAVAEKLGDGVLFEATIDGKTFIRRTDAARQLAQVINDIPKQLSGNIEDHQVDLDLMGYAAELVVNKDGNRYDLDLVLRDDDGNIVRATGLQFIAKDNVRTVNIKPLLERVNVSPEGLKSNLENHKAALDAARRNLPELEEAANRPFAKAQELEEKQKRLDEVEEELSVSAAPASDADSAQYSKAASPLPPSNRADVRGELEEEFGRRGLRNLERAGVKIVSREEAGKILGDSAGAEVFGKSGRVEGFDLDGNVYLIDGNISKGNSVSTLSHELGVHARNLGFKNTGAFRRILKGMERRKRKDPAVREAFRRAEKAGTSQKNMAEEALAYLVAQNPKHGLVRRLIAQVKKFLVEHGISERILNKMDLQALAMGAVKREARRPTTVGSSAVEQSGNTGEFNPEDPDIRYSIADEPEGKEETTRAIRSTENLNAEIDGVKSTTSESEGAKIINEIMRKLREAGMAGGVARFSEKQATKLVDQYRKVSEVINDPHKSIAEKQKFAAGFAQKLPHKPRARLLQRLSKISRYKTEKAQLKRLNEFLRMAEKAVTDHLRTEIMGRISDKVKPTKGNIGLKSNGRADVVKGRGAKLERDLKYLRDTVLNLDTLDDVDMEAARLVGELKKLEEDLENASSDKERGRISDLIDDVESKLNMVEVFGGFRELGFDRLVQASKALDFIFDNGTAEWRITQEFWRNRNEINREAALRDITGSEEPDQETEAQRSRREERERSVMGKFKEALSATSNAIQSWELMLDKISGRSGSKTLQSWLVRHFGSVIHKATRDHERMNLETHEQLMDKAAEIFGVQPGAQLGKVFARLNKRVAGRVFTYSEEGKEDMAISPLEAAYWYQIAKAKDNEVMKETFARMGITEQTMQQIEELMGPELKQWADWLVDEFYQDFHGDVNEIYKQVYGIDLEKTKDYVPWRRKVTGRAADKEQGGFLHGITTGTIKKGSLHRRVTNYKPFRQVSLNDVLMAHVADMNHFKAWALPSREVNGTFNSPQVQDAIRRYYGASSLRAIRRFQDDFVKADREMKGDMQWLDKWRGRVTTSMIGGNPVVMFKQLTSIPAFAADIPAGQWAKYTAMALGNPAKAARALGKSTMIKARYKKGFERDVASAMRKSGSDMVSQVRRFPDKMMVLTQLGDKAAIIVGGYAVYRYHLEKNKAAGLDDARAREEALEEFEKAVERSQQSGNVKDLGWVQRGDSVMKLFTMYMTAPASYSRNIFTAVRNMKRDPKDSAKRLFIYGVVLPMLFQAVADALMGIDGDDDDKERFMLNQAKAIAMGPFNGLPILRDLANGIWNAAQGNYWMASNASYSPVAEVGKSAIKTVYNAGRAAREDDAVYLVRTMKDASDLAGHLSGVPVRPIRRIATGLSDATGTDIPFHEAEETKHPVRRAMGYSRFALGE